MRGAAVVCFMGLVLGCSPAAKPDPSTEQKRVDDLAVAFERWVIRHYEARLARDTNAPAPSLAVRLKAREELKEALQALGLALPDLEEGPALKKAVDAVRATLVAHDYVFLPLAQGGATEDDDLGIALAHVRRREPARSKELWGRKVEYKLVVYEPLLRDYPAWKAKLTGLRGLAYSPGRFSTETVFVDHEALVERARNLPPAYQALGLEGLIAEVELRQAAYLLYMREILGEPTRAALEHLHEKVLWSAVRYGDPDVAWNDVLGLATSEGTPDELRAAAGRVKARIPESIQTMKTKQERAEAMRRVAEDAWRDLG